MEPTQQRFGVFSPLFDSEPGYLDLLHLHAPKSNLTVSRVIECGRLSSDPFLDIGRLLDEANWRPHLVAAVALSVLVAYLRDPDFSEQAKVRVRARCPVDASRLTPLSPLERHVAFGPAGAPERSAKAVCALIYLLRVFGQSDWLTTELASPDLSMLLSGDRDNTSSIAEDWLGSLKAILRSLTLKTA